MKANEVPEKIILSADRETGILHDEWVISDLTDNIKIEYTRTDAFIKKAASWLMENASDYKIAFSNKYNTGRLVEDFVEYMKK